MHLRKTKDTIFEGKFGNLNYIRTRSALHSPAGNRTRKEPRREMRETDGGRQATFRAFSSLSQTEFLSFFLRSLVESLQKCSRKRGTKSTGEESLFSISELTFSPSAPSEIFQCHKLQTPKWPHGVAGRRHGGGGRGREKGAAGISIGLRWNLKKMVVVFTRGKWKRPIEMIQRSEKWLVRGWVKFVPALA